MASCKAAHIYSVPCQPKCSWKKAVRGQHRVLAKPATKVMPEIMAGASRSCNWTTVAKAVSNRPMLMPAPVNSQAKHRVTGPVAQAMLTRAAASTMLEITSSVRPP